MKKQLIWAVATMLILIMTLGGCEGGDEFASFALLSIGNKSDETFQPPAEAGTESENTAEDTYWVEEPGEPVSSNNEPAENYNHTALHNTIANSLQCVLALKSDGTVMADGAVSKEIESDVLSQTDVVSIAGGFIGVAVLKNDGTVVAAGASNPDYYNYFGQYDVSDWTDIISVAAGQLHTVGLKSDGTVVTAGSNRYGENNVSDWKDIVAISAGDSHTVGLKSDGTVIAVGYSYDDRCDVSDWTDIVAISAGAYTLGLKSDGTVVMVGDKGTDAFRYPKDEIHVRDWTDIMLP